MQASPSSQTAAAQALGLGLLTSLHPTGSSVVDGPEAKVEDVVVDVVVVVVDVIVVVVVLVVVEV